MIKSILSNKVYQINFIKSISSNQFYHINFIIYFILPNKFHQINFILTVSFYQFHFINFILSISFYQFFLSILCKKFILYTLELISSKYSKFLHSVEEGNPSFSSCMDLAIKKHKKWAIFHISTIT